MPIARSEVRCVVSRRGALVHHGAKRAGGLLLLLPLRLLLLLLERDRLRAARRGVELIRGRIEVGWRTVGCQVMQPLGDEHQRSAGVQIGRDLRQGKTLRCRVSELVDLVCHLGAIPALSVGSPTTLNVTIAFRPVPDKTQKRTVIPLD